MTELTESRNFDVYVEGFDAGFGQKWADLVPAFRDLPEGARVLDVGSGSGTLLRHLSAGQPHLELFAVEPSATLRATTGQACPDVHVVDGDATALPYDDASMDVVVLSSVLHEVFSYNGYDHGAVRAALREAARALRPGGRLAVRDGVRPDDADRLVTMALLTDHAVEWFERFRVDFRPSHPQPGIVAEDVMAGRMVRLSLGDAAEFLSKKDYQANWDAEVQEQFGVFTKGEWAGEVSAAGFGTVDACSYLHPWVARHRYEGEVVLVDAPVLFPPTTVAIHATK